MLLSIKHRLITMSFLQFFVWGAWLTTIGTYCMEGKGWSFPEFGAVFSTLALSSLIMPSLVGIAADKWFRSEQIYGILQVAYGIILFFVPTVDDPDALYYYILGAMICYMPTISLSNSISYSVLKSNGLSVLKDFPPIRVWGTIGFIAAMWVTNLTGSKATGMQFIIAGSAAIILGIYSFTLPACRPERSASKSTSWVDLLGLNAFKLFANYKMALFFIFSMLLGAALQLSNMYGDAYLDSFPPGTFVQKYSTIVLSISQVSETAFILTIPFFMKRFGIKQVMLFAMFAWVIRYGFFAAGDESYFGLLLIVLSNIIYGMAFDFFNISGSMFVETTTEKEIRSSAQGLFVMMTNGFGAFIGTIASSWVINAYFINADKSTNWTGAWYVFAGYSLVVAVLFALLFKHRHDPQSVNEISH
jgi:NHS family xanthosine MFS transporter